MGQTGSVDCSRIQQNIGREWPKRPRHWTTLGQSRPEFGPCPAKFGRDWPKVPKDFAEVGPKSATFCPDSTDSGQFRSMRALSSVQPAHRGGSRYGTPEIPRTRKADLTRIPEAPATPDIKNASRNRKEKQVPLVCSRTQCPRFGGQTRLGLVWVRRWPNIADAEAATSAQQSLHWAIGRNLTTTSKITQIRRNLPEVGLNQVRLDRNQRESWPKEARKCPKVAETKPKLGGSIRKYVPNMTES